jgi:hypothetical protein
VELYVHFFVRGALYTPLVLRLVPVSVVLRNSSRFCRDVCDGLKEGKREKEVKGCSEKR